MKILAVIEDTFKECLYKKILLGFFGISTLSILAIFLLFAVDIKGYQVAIGTVFGESGTVSMSQLREVIIKIEGVFSMALFTAGLFLSIFATADLVPSSLRKGKIDLYLSRPISRPQFLLGKFLGAVSVVAVNILYAVAGVWLVFGIKTGIWNPYFLYSAVSIIFMFAVLYSVMLLVGVLVQGTAITMIVAYVMIMLSPILDKRETFTVFLSNEIQKNLIELFYQIIPRYAEMTNVTMSLVEGKPVENWTPVLASLLIALVAMSLAVHIFSRKDF